jgi:hypothetical protein
LLFILFIFAAQVQTFQVASTECILLDHGTKLLTILAADILLLEAPGRRAEALEAYRRAAGSSEFAAKRVAVLEVPREVTLTGVTGIEKGSLDPRRLEPFNDPAQHFRESLFLSECWQSTGTCLCADP